MTTLETLEIELRANAAQVTAELQKAQKGLGDFGAAASRSGTQADVGFRGLQEVVRTTQKGLQGIGDTAVNVGRKHTKAAEETTYATKLLEASVARVELRLAGLGDEAGTLGYALAEMGGKSLLAGAALGGIYISIEKSLEKFSEAETATTRLNAVLAATGGAAGQTSKELQEYAFELAKKTTASKEAILDAASALLTYQSVTGDLFERVLKDATDLAALSGGDVVSSVHALGRALEDPTNGLMALRRAHIMLKPEQIQLINAFIESGDKAEALKVMLAAIEGKSDGVAEAMGGTLVGSVGHAKEAFGELFEQLGGIINSGDRVTHLVQGVADKVNALAEAIERLKVHGGLRAISESAAALALGIDPNGLGKSKGSITETTDPDFQRSVLDPYHASLPKPRAAAAPVVADPGSATGQKAIKALEQKRRLASETARQAAIDNAVNEAQNAADEKHETLSKQQIETIRKLAAQTYDLANARKVDTEASKEAENQSKALTKSLNEGLIAAQKEDAGIGMTAVAKAASDAAAEVQKYAAAYPALNGQITASQKATEEAIVSTKVKAAADKDLYDLYQATLTPLEQYHETMKRIADDQPFAHTPEQIEAVQRAIDNANDSVNRYKSIFDEAASSIADDFEQMFEAMESGSIKKIRNIATTFLGTFKHMLAEMAEMAIAQPIIVPIIQSLGSTLGISQTGINSQIQKLTGLSGEAVGAGSLANGASLFGGASTWLNNFGAAHFGTALPWQPGTTATGVLGGAAQTIGGIGLAYEISGVLAHELGLGKKAGGILQGAATGATVGALVPIPGVGIVGGALIGAGLGFAKSLFGGKPSDMTEAATVNLASGVADLSGATSGKKYSKENTDARNAFVAFAQQLSGSLATSVGHAVDTNLEIKFGNRDGSSFTLYGNDKTTINSGAQGLKDLTSQITALYAKSDPASEAVKNLQTAIARIDFDNAAQALNDIQFAINFNHLGDRPAQALDDVDNAMAALNTTFHNFQIQADRTGLSVDKVNEAYRKQVGYLQEPLRQATSGNILSMILPGFGELTTENEGYAKALHDYAVVGLDTTQLTLEHQLRIKTLLAQNDKAQQAAIQSATDLVNRYGQISTGFGSLLDELRNGKYTTLTPTANLADLRAQVLSTGQAAQLGDADAQEKLLTLLPQFLDLSAQVNGYNADYAADQKTATSLASAAKTVAERQLTVQQGILDAASDALTLLTDIAGHGTGGNANDKLVAALQKGYAGLSAAQIDAIFTSAGVSVAPGGGRRTAFLNDGANSGINDRLNDIFHALGVPGFADGGWITGGIPGRDSVPTLHMPGEFTLRARSAAALGAPALDFMNRTGRLPSNDNGDLASLRADVQRLTAVVFTGFFESKEHLSGIRASNASLAQRAQAKAAGA